MADISVSYNSFGGRCCGAISLAAVGFAAFIGSFILVYWNEGRAVYTSEAIAEAEVGYTHVSCSKLDPFNDGKLVYSACKVTNPEYFTEGPYLSVSATGLWFKRTVEMYQWYETKDSRTVKDSVGGGSHTVTVYNYYRKWSTHKICTSSFHHSGWCGSYGSCTNYCDSWPMNSQTRYAANAKEGVYDIPEALEEQADSARYVPLDANVHLKSPPLGNGPPSAVTDSTTYVYGHSLYTGDPRYPQVGDMRITWTFSSPSSVSIMAEQRRSTLVPWPSHYNPAYNVFWLEDGRVSVATMVDHQRRNNTLLTWGLRFVGWVACWIGLALFLGPLSVMPDIVPCIGPLIGDLVGCAICCIACCVASGLTMLAITISWIRFRPALGVPALFLAVCFLCCGFFCRSSSHKRSRRNQSWTSVGPFRRNKKRNEEEEMPDYPVGAPQPQAGPSSSSTQPFVVPQYSGYGTMGNPPQQQQGGIQTPPGVSPFYVPPPQQAASGPGYPQYPPGTGAPPPFAPPQPQPPLGVPSAPPLPSAPPAPSDFGTK